MNSDIQKCIQHLQKGTTLKQNPLAAQIMKEAKDSQPYVSMNGNGKRKQRGTNTQIERLKQTLQALPGAQNGNILSTIPKLGLLKNRASRNSFMQAVLEANNNNNNNSNTPKTKENHVSLTTTTAVTIPTSTKVIPTLTRKQKKKKAERRKKKALLQKPL